ncbi:MAG: ATP-binding cassette domain-containing protein, partial [Clostridia bacterium]|nr:ATP-binding cassette domain-containing protein [Clostridia bacterium]
IAMVFQNYALYPHMTVFDNMAFGLKLRKTPKDEIKRRVEEAAKILDIAHLLNRKPKALSGGQRQRVALGRAIVREPKVFLFDEPLSNLDAKLRVAMRTEITKLHQRLQTTFIYVTHDQTEAMTMASRIVVMKDGIVQQVDTPQNLYDFPGNEFVAGFIGSPQMNFFNVRLSKEGQDVVATFGDNKIVVPNFKIAKFVDESYIGKEVIMGIRPENIDDGAEFLEKYSTAAINVNVEVTEQMGSETYLYLTTTGKDGNIIARVDPRTTSRAGDKIRVAFDVNHLHFFDKDTEKTILSR